jgi:hypothetical protein
MLEKFFSAPKTLRRLRGGISGPHTSMGSQMTSNATDTRQPAWFDTFEPPLISAASFSGKAMF